MWENGELRIVVRRERDATPVFELAGVGPTVSMDGKRLAYWRTTTNVGDTNLPNAVATDLRVLAVPCVQSLGMMRRGWTTFEIASRTSCGSAVASAGGRRPSHACSRGSTT